MRIEDQPSVPSYLREEMRFSGHGLIPEQSTGEWMTEIGNSYLEGVKGFIQSRNKRPTVSDFWLEIGERLDSLRIDHGSGNGSEELTKEVLDEMLSGKHVKFDNWTYSAIRQIVGEDSDLKVEAKGLIRDSRLRRAGLERSGWLVAIFGNYLPFVLLQAPINTLLKSMGVDISSVYASAALYYIARDAIYLPNMGRNMFVARDRAGEADKYIAEFVGRIFNDNKLRKYRRIQSSEVVDPEVVGDAIVKEYPEQLWGILQQGALILSSLTTGAYVSAGVGVLGVAIYRFWSKLKSNVNLHETNNDRVLRSAHFRDVSYIVNMLVAASTVEGSAKIFAVLAQVFGTELGYQTLKNTFAGHERTYGQFNRLLALMITQEDEVFENVIELEKFTSANIEFMIDHVNFLNNRNSTMAENHLRPLISIYGGKLSALQALIVKHELLRVRNYELQGDFYLLQRNFDSRMSMFEESVDDMSKQHGILASELTPDSDKMDDGQYDTEWAKGVIMDQSRWGELFMGSVKLKWMALSKYKKNGGEIPDEVKRKIKEYVTKQESTFAGLKEVMEKGTRADS